MVNFLLVRPLKFIYDHVSGFLVWTMNYAKVSLFLYSISVIFLGLNWYLSDRENEVLIENTEIFISETSKNLESLSENLNYNRKVLDLSIEFGFDPTIIMTTRELAVQTIEAADLDTITWRYMNTPDELTYIMLSIIAIESNGNVTARGDAGQAYGLTQMWLTTAQAYDEAVTGSDLLTVERHLQLAFEHFVDLLERYHGNMTFAALAWNRGEGAISRSIARGEVPFNGYVGRIFREAAFRNATF